MKKKIRSIFEVVLSILILLAGVVVGTNKIVEATGSTTYTNTLNADGEVIHCQDGYLPEATYDRLNLCSPQDMVSDIVTIDGKEVEYLYIINSGDTSTSPFITKIDLSDVYGSATTIDIVNNLPYIKSPTGLWIATTTVHGVTQKELYIVDSAASYSEVIEPNEREKELGFSSYKYEYVGLIYRVPFDETGTKLLLDKYTIIHEPTTMVNRNDEDYEMYEFVCVDSLDELKDRQIIETAKNFTSEVTVTEDFEEKTKYNRVVCKVGYECEERVVPLGQFMMKTSSFGQDTVFSPKKVAVDSAGNMFVASDATSSGMIQLSYSGEFVSFFVVNSVSYDFLYQFIKKYGTDAQLEHLDVTKPKSFSNVFIDNQDLVYSISKKNSVVFNKYSTGGTSILENAISSIAGADVTDAYVTDDGMIYITISSGLIYVCQPDGKVVFYFGSNDTSTKEDMVGFFSNLEAIIVDKDNKIWVIDSTGNYLQTFTATDYANSIFDAIISYKNHNYEQSRSAWEKVLKYDSLSVLANDGLGKAYYYDLDYSNSLKFFSTSKNRSLYSNVFWELRNDFLQANLTTIIMIIIGVIVLFFIIGYIFNHNKKLNKVKKKIVSIKDKRWYKDLTVGFRLIIKPNDTFYEMKTHQRGSILGASIYYVLGIIAFLLNTYCYALPFQHITTASLNPTTVFAAEVIVLFIFVLCNYLVSAINDGEGTFADIYKFTGYSLLPMIICLPISVGISYGLTLNEQVILTILKILGFFGSGLILIIGILETHNYTFTQTVKNILLTLVFMILFLIICMVVIIMFDQIKTFIEQIWKEVKLRAGWY